MALHLQSQQELVRILQIQLQQEQERLEDMNNADAKISEVMESLIPILEKYPIYRSEVAKLLGFILPTSPTSTPRIIEIVDGDQKNVFCDTKNSKYTKSTNCLDENSLDNQTEFPATENTSISFDVIWYNSISGEVSVGSERRYFRILWNNKQNEHQVGLKKSESAKRWSKDINPTTQPLIDAVWQEFKAGKPAEFFLQKLYEAAEEVGGKFTGSLCNLGTSSTFHLNESFGIFHILNEDIEVGHSEGNWWDIRPGRNKVYCSGNIHQFTEILKGLKTDIVLESQKSSDRLTPPHKTAEITQIETAEANKTPTSSKPSDCWYTPPEIVELVEKVLGNIDLDPCSDDGKHIPAKLHYTATEDGLNQQWQGKVFINPPYSCPGKWIEKLISEVNDSNVTEAIALVPASTDTKWFSPLWSQPICFWKGRIKFLDTNYQPKLPARQSHCLVYWGENADKFYEIFSEYGEVKTPINSQSTEIETITPFIKQLEPLVSEKWVLEATEDDQVTVYETDKKNSNWVIITDRHESQGLFFIDHETAFSNHAKTIEEAVERAVWWFEQEIINSLDNFIDILNGYNTGLIATRNDSTTAYIHQDKELFGTVFFKDNERLELAEREKQLLRDTYSIDIDNLIEDIQSQGKINPHEYLMGIGKLEVELNRADIIQNALYSLSNLNDLIIVRQGEIFKFYNDERLENLLSDDLGTIKIIDTEIVVDKELNHLLLNQYSILINQLITDIFNEKSEINSEDYIISNPTIKELVVKEVWDDKDFETANQMLNEVAESSPVLNQLNEVKNQQLLLLNEDENIEVEDFYLIEYDDDDPTWMDIIKVEIEKLEGFKITHDEVYLTVTHYGTGVGSIQHLDCILEIQPKLINELAKHDFDLEEFLASADIPFRLDHPKPVVGVTTTEHSDTQTSEQVKKPQSGSISGKKPDSPKLNENEQNAF